VNPFLVAGGAVEVLELPLRRPFITALGTLTLARNAVLRLKLRGGGRGWGEASSSIVNRHLSPSRLAGVLRRALARAAGRDARDPRLARSVWASCGEAASAAAAFECALREAVAAQYRTSLRDWFGGALDRVATSMTISAGAREDAAAEAAESAADGFRVLKVKVGSPEGWREDLERTSAAARAGRRPRLILDGNQGLTEASALRLLDACQARGLRVELLEQPLARSDLRGMARLKRRLPVPLAADESLRSVDDAREILDRDAADVLNLKVAKTGIEASLEIAALARAAGKRLMIGCMRESARGLSPSVHLACGTGAFSFIDLDSDVPLGDGQPRGGWRRRGPLLETA